ncbi:MAG: AAA family ATPase [Flavobacteriales bacterium]|nr:AAA family ATPase [Flavobacteriales bacterium]
MYHRKIHYRLRDWAQSEKRKPLVLRGARQVGKTTAVIEFAATFKQFIHLNLERTEHRKLFETERPIAELVDAIFFQARKNTELLSETLLFIDEIQAEPKTFPILRYLYEEFPDLKVIAAGSLLETLFDVNRSFPVGRVEYMQMHPVNFSEFLGAIGEHEAQKALEFVPVKSYAHDELKRLFNTYAIIGGMPEIVAEYAASRDLTKVSKLYASLIQGYLEDVEKYAKNETQRQVIRHVINASFLEAGIRIKFQGFGRSNYRSREMAEAFRTLEQAMVIRLMYPVTGTTLPLIPDLKRSPKLQVLDTGMFNHMSGVQQEMVLLSDLYPIHQGRLMEHLVIQEFISMQLDPLFRPHFWVREKVNSDAEVDMVIPLGADLIPIEVKAGKTGKLRSLHQFMDVAPHSMAIRVHGGNFSIEKVKTISGKEFHLMNVPHYAAAQLPHYVKHLAEQVTFNG